MVYIKDIPGMGYTCRAYLICTLRKNLAVIFTYIYATYCEPCQLSRALLLYEFELYYDSWTINT